MDSNPLAEIAKSVNKFKKQIESGEGFGLNDEQKAEFQKQLKTNPQVKEGLSELSKKMAEFRNITKKMNNANH